MNEAQMVALIAERHPDEFSLDELRALQLGVRQSVRVRAALRERLLLEECLVYALATPPAVAVLQETSPQEPNTDAPEAAANGQHGNVPSARQPVAELPGVTAELGRQAAVDLGRQAVAGLPLWLKLGGAVLVAAATIAVPAILVVVATRAPRVPDPPSAQAVPQVEEQITQPPAANQRPVPGVLPEVEPPVEAPEVRGQAQGVGRIIRRLAKDPDAQEIFSFDSEGSPSDQSPPLSGLNQGEER